MIIQQILCLGIGEFILLVVYAIFACLGSRRDNFYQARRWKAAVWISIISGFFILAMICVPTIIFTYNDFVETTTLNLDYIYATITLVLAFVLPLMFIITLSTYNRLVWSDDLLDKIRKDPNKGNKSPIQPF
jgi:hypothetical protein